MHEASHREADHSYSDHTALMSRRAMERSRWELRPRDLEILRWVCRHGIVTTDQIARQFFSAKRTAYIRVAKLIDMTVLQGDRLSQTQPQLLRVTRHGASLVTDTIRPARLVRNRIDHSLALVDLLHELSRLNPDADIDTERQLQGEWRRALADGSRDVGYGRMPDALLRFADGRRIAVELDLTPKSNAEFARILLEYATEDVTGVWWFCPSQRVADRLRVVVTEQGMDQLVQVFVWNH